MMQHNQIMKKGNRMQVKPIRKTNRTKIRATMKAPPQEAQIVLRFQTRKSLLLAYLRTGG